VPALGFPAITIIAETRSSILNPTHTFRRAGVASFALFGAAAGETGAFNEKGWTSCLEFPYSTAWFGRLRVIRDRLGDGFCESVPLLAEPPAPDESHCSIPPAHRIPAQTRAPPGPRAPRKTRAVS
jgi:hypothetical protein